MAATVKCAKLGQELPAIDPSTPLGLKALKFAQMVGGAEMRARIAAGVSQKAWDQWKDHMVMIFNEYRLDPTSDQANQVLKMHMEAFFFGEQKPIDNFVPPPK